MKAFKMAEARARYDPELQLLWAIPVAQDSHQFHWIRVRVRAS